MTELVLNGVHVCHVEKMRNGAKSTEDVGLNWLRLWWNHSCRPGGSDGPRKRKLKVMRNLKPLRFIFKVTVKKT